MPGIKTPKTVKENFYFKFSNAESYKDLTIKKNQLTKDLINLYNNNTWNLKGKAEALDEKTKVEHNNNFNSFLNSVYLLDYIKTPKIITSINKNDFYKLIYKDESNTDRTEKNYIDGVKKWVKYIFVDHDKDLNFDWFIINQNKVFYEILKFNHENNNKLETLRKDINTLMHLLKISLGERVEVVNKYKVLNMALSKMHDMKERDNILDEREEKAFIEYSELLKLRQQLYNDWLETYENAPLTKYKNPILRIKNIMSLLVSFYVLYPPMRLEIMNLKIIKSEDEATENDASILIKNRKNIFLYFQTEKKGHKPIKFNINDPVIKSYSESNINILIDNIVESVELYPREYLFETSKGEPYKEKSLQKALYDLVPGKNLGVNGFRSSYYSYWYYKMNKNQLDRAAFFSRTSPDTIINNYVKRIYNNNSIQETNNNKIIEKPLKIEVKTEIKAPEIKNKKLTDEQQQARHTKKKEYLNHYYESNKNVMLEKAKQNDKANYFLRYTRELKSNMIKWENIKPATIIKYKLHHENGKFWSDLESNN
jgi:hypothetical protein